MPKYIQSAFQARLSDQNCIQEGVPSLVLMENAARQIAGFIMEHYPNGQIVFVCGPGNNGADGLAAARLLRNRGRDTVCIFEDTGLTSADEQVQLKAALNSGVPVLPYDTSPEVYKKAALLCDCLFGSGLSRNITGVYKELIERISQAQKPVLAVDIASGLDGNTGHIMGTAVRADWTLALDTLKEGHLRNDGPGCSGTVKTADIGIPERLHTSRLFVLDSQAAAEMLPARPLTAHKGTFGKVLLCGGSLQMQGALSMAADACFHAGCGTLTLYTPRSAALAIASKTDTAMIIPADEINGFFDLDACIRLPELLRNYTFCGCGNGMGKGKGARLIAETLLESDMPLLLDADAINCVASRPELLDRKAVTILTPHVKEFSRLSGLPVQEIVRDPIQAARSFLNQHPGTVLVLKGAVTVAADRTTMYFLDAPCDALAKGGSGDVLAGLISGLAAWIPDPLQAAALGVYMHNASARSSSIAPECFTPKDIVNGFSSVLCSLRQLQPAEN